MSRPNPKGHRPEPAHLRALIERAHLSQVECADSIGVDRRTFRRYLAGDSPIPYPVQFAVECLAEAIAAERMTAAAAKELSQRELRDQLADAEKQRAALAPVSHKFQRVSADADRMARELRRRRRTTTH